MGEYRGVKIGWNFGAMIEDLPIILNAKAVSRGPVAIPTHISRALKRHSENADSFINIDEENEMKISSSKMISIPILDSVTAVNIRTNEDKTAQMISPKAL